MDEVEYTSNEEMLSQVWLNILGNAIKFSKDGGEVRIYCAKHGSSVRVEIEDYGVGMSEETRQHALNGSIRAQAAAPPPETGWG